MITTAVRTVADLRHTLSTVPDWALIHIPETSCDQAPADMDISYSPGELLLEPRPQPRNRNCRCCPTPHLSPWQENANRRAIRTQSPPPTDRDHPPVGRMHELTAADVLDRIAGVPDDAAVVLSNASYDLEEVNECDIEASYHAGVLWLAPTQELLCTCCRYN